MTTSRRSFIRISAAATGAAFFVPQWLLATRSSGPILGVTDWNLERAGQVEAVGMAARLGFRGVEVSLGRDVASHGNRLPLDDAEKQAAYRAAFASYGVDIAGTCLDRLHDNYLKSDPLAQRWVAEGIEISRRLNAKVMLIPFFRAAALETRREMDFVADFIREIGPEAERAGVILGLENTISAEDNVRILDRAGSPAVKVYYDTGNSAIAGFNVYDEIRWLGRDRICQFHLKDNPHYLGQGSIDFVEVMRAILEIGFTGYANLETVSPSGDVSADMRRNRAYIRSIKRALKK